MVRITVSSDNFNKLIAAKPDEEIRIEHMNHPGSIVLVKKDFVKQMTIEQIEAELGYHIEIVGNKNETCCVCEGHMIPVENSNKGRFFR